MTHRSTRRRFLADTARTATALAAAPAWAGAQRSDAGTPGSLKGFIVSDAHFGWSHEQQPSPETQRKMMSRIVTRFPDLDLFIDTGDAHHSGAGDDARGLWTDIIAGGCGTSPFFYIAGNHELVPTMGLDPEWRCNILGSVSCRPYYSFDLKGIHFVSLPEMKRAVLIDRETMEWLALDLEIHRDRSVIILTHNNLLGTTCPLGEFGYRGLANSEELLELLERYPNVIGWLNGHNHTYEVMKRDGTLFVSNGRIGGFVPPEGWGHVGQGHLGGIYFEIGCDRFVVRSYSATAERFLDELGDVHLSGRIDGATTLDADAPPRYCYGFGGSRDGQRVPVLQHCTTRDTSAELFFMGTDDPSFNDDPEFSLYQCRKHASLGPHHQLMGATVQMHPRWQEMWVENNVYRWLDPGIRLLAREKPEGVTRMTVPLRDHGKATYYRCPPGRTYRATIDVETVAGGQRLALHLMVHDRNQKRLAKIPGPGWTLAPGRQTLHADFAVPEFPSPETIYTDPGVDNALHLMVMSEWSNLLQDTTLHRFALSFADADGATDHPALIVNGVRHAHAGSLENGEVTGMKIPVPRRSRLTFETRAAGSRRATWLMRYAAVDWQVRNALVEDRGDHLMIGPMRNTFSDRHEIVIAPVTRSKDPFVHHLRHIDKAAVYPLNRGNRQLKVRILQAADTAAVEVVAERKPRGVVGAKGWHWADGRVMLEAGQGDELRIAF